MEMLIGGKWCGAVGGETEVVQSPYDGHPVDSVPVGGVDDAAAAIDGAEVAARVQRETPAHERFAVLLRAADLVDERAEDIAQTLSAASRSPRRVARRVGRGR
jgi:glyceraldehyde-3-phosphate dehydrogenase (NADP+)